MKLQISFDMTDLDHALEIASAVAPHADILEIGTLLIYSHGAQAVKQFKATFPDKAILADAKIADRGKENVTVMANAQADWITVIAGTNKNIIHAACTTAHDLNKKVMLDLCDANSVAQSALEAKNLGADALLFQQLYDENEPHIFIDKWEMIKGNTELPIFISAKIKRETINPIIKLNPDGIIIGSSITQAEHPEHEALFFKELIEKNS